MDGAIPDGAIPDGQPTSGADLEGFVVLLTNDRRADELTASFRRRGARVVRAPTLRILPVADDEDLLERTRALVRRPPDAVVVTTAIGFRAWIEAADAVGLAPHLLDVLAESRLMARGPKARGAIRAAGLVEDFAATSETSAEVVERLLADGVAGRRVAVQVHGASDPALLERLAVAGADVDAVRTYRWGPAPDPVAVQRAVDAVCRSALDAVIFTSAPGAEAFLDVARRARRLDTLVGSLRGDVLAAAVGPVAAAPLRAAGIEPLVPDRSRLGALVRAVGDHLAGEHVRSVLTGAGTLQLRGRAVTFAGRVLDLTPAQRGMLRELIRAPGRVVDRPSLLAVLPGAGDLHAVEVAVARLRTALGAPGVIETVVKRGYRLAVREDAGTATVGHRRPGPTTP